LHNSQWGDMITKGRYRSGKKMGGKKRKSLSTRDCPKKKNCRDEKYIAP